MKKLLSLLLAAVMVLGCSAALAETYALNEETLTLEQGPVWYFYFLEEDAGAPAELFATPSWGDNWQFSENPTVDNVYHSICEWDGVRAMPGTWLGKHIDIVVSFKAPKAGSITIDPMTLACHTDGAIPDNGYLLSITKASGEAITLLLPNMDDANAFVEIPALEGLTTEAITATVLEGDIISFVVRSSDDGGAAILLEPSITYAE